MKFISKNFRKPDKIYEKKKIPGQKNGTTKKALPKNKRNL